MSSQPGTLHQIHLLTHVFYSMMAFISPTCLQWISWFVTIHLRCHNLSQIIAYICFQLESTFKTYTPLWPSLLSYYACFIDIGKKSESESVVKCIKQQAGSNSKKEFKDPVGNPFRPSTSPKVSTFIVLILNPTLSILFLFK